MASKLPPISFARGVANRGEETKTPAGFARAADNVDISDAGVIHRRQGFGLAASLAGAHSLWRDPRVPFALVADATTLYRFAAGVLTSLVTGLSGAPIDYAWTPRGIYWSDGVRAGAIDVVSGAASPWGVEVPPTNFNLTPTVGVGGLAAGIYGVALSFSNAAGEEGGATDTQFIPVAEGGGVQITGVPASVSGDAAKANIYVTAAGGTQLFFAGAVAPGTGVTLVGAGQRGRLLAHQFCQPFPAVRAPLLKAGRLFGLVGNLLLWSEPLYYGLFNAATGYMPFAGEEAVMLAAPEGDNLLMYLGTKTRTYLLQGASLEDVKISLASHVGVIPGSMCMVQPDALNLEAATTPVPMWVDQRGVPVIGTPAGVVTGHQKFVYPVYDRAAAAFVQANGGSRYIVSGRGGRASGLVATDSVVARVYNNGGGN